ncbi:hypothetical protein [Mucilaginibacter ginkgonis]|uniref:Uncharacterized protein n=1 Tax=Mucilaginibacter ginkgonis TaxID=2682091 RepID=A0A6I4I1L4_9SPHI|nr:hypothetical protein [Mucilaginibacter ginkgonis]QQL49026.1 hypothetical protein GO620_012665 [Mucilaginibacter ginkgonis]
MALAGCKPRHIAKREIISFKPIQGIQYTEVHRRLQNGLIFNEYGYQLEPQWELEFLKNDSARIYSPIKKTYINFPLSRGYDSIFNTARTWYKMRKMSKDSLLLEILKFSGDSIETKGNKVFMTFYSNDYIRNVLHSDTGALRRPTHADTAYLKKLIALSQKDSTKAFAARSPVQLSSNNPNFIIEKKTEEPTLLNHFDTSDDYMNPSFYIRINNGNEDFGYSFSVYVDASGRMTYGKPLVGFYEEEYHQAFLRKSHKLLDGYLQYYLHVKPGSTLGIPHASEIALHITMRKGK